MRQVDALEEGDTAEERILFRNVSILLGESVSCSHGRVLAHGALYEDAGDADDEPVHEVGDEEDKKAQITKRQDDIKRRRQTCR